ncbi:MAG: sulfotransferase domain-containing protein [Rhodospirillales bacterium]|nr:sulfotransferase domain-containing protein [Rhodospirillales bacterium]
MPIAYRSALRHAFMSTLFFLPPERKVPLERRLRGREEGRKLGLADVVIVSFGKSGRTWLRVMLSRVYQVKHGLAQRHLIGFDNLHARNRQIPRVFFTHDNYLKDFTGHADTKEDYYDKKVVLLVRSPADVAVSQYFQWKYRMRPTKKVINNYPDADVSLYDFVMRPNAGLPKVIEFMNGWARELPRLKHLLVVRYEDMRADPGEVLGRIVDFIGTPATPAEIEEAVRFASVENMRALEQKRVFWLSGGRMVAKDRKNPNTFKVRRAKVGGYREDFSEEQTRRIDEMIATSLDPVFGCGPAAASAAEPAPGASQEPAAQADEEASTAASA